MDNPRAKGQLFSIDAVRGGDLTPAAKRLFEEKRKEGGGWSIWDASSIFFDLHELNVDNRPSARTLLLLYAADLRFRIRWQVLPSLEKGQTIIAAPYVETAIAFGLACDLPRKWMTELFQFAPEPAGSYWLDGVSVPTDPAGAGFLEFCKAILPDDFSQRFGEHFRDLERSGKCQSIKL